MFFSNHSDAAPVFTHRLTAILEKMGALIWSRPFLRLICRVYRPVVEKEVHQLGLSGEDRVLFIGGGSLPYSAVLIHELTGARVDVLDRDRQACLYARRIQRHFSPNRFCVYCHCAQNCDPSHYLAVVVARQVEAKETLVPYIEHNAMPGAKILVREGHCGSTAARLIRK